MLANRKGDLRSTVFRHETITADRFDGVVTALPRNRPLRRLTAGAWENSLNFSGRYADEIGDLVDLVDRRSVVPKAPRTYGPIGHADKIGDFGRAQTRLCKSFFELLLDRLGLLLGRFFGRFRFRGLSGDRVVRTGLPRTREVGLDVVDFDFDVVEHNTR